MKLIVTLIFLVAIIAPGFAQRRCFTCANCQQPFERSSNLLQTCTVPGPGTTEPTPPTNPEPTPPTNNTEEIPLPTTSEAPINTTNGVITSPGLTVAPVHHALYKRDIVPFAQTLRCYRIRRVNGDVTVYSRGCVSLLNTIEQTCAQFGETAECKICNEDECNGATQIITSVGTILAALLIVLKLY